jgi:hypothetical protein
MAAEKPLPPPDELVRPAPEGVRRYAKGAVLVRGNAFAITNLGRVAPHTVRVRTTIEERGRPPRYTTVREGERYANAELVAKAHDGQLDIIIIRYELYVHQVNDDGSIDAVVISDPPPSAPQPKSSGGSHDG